MKLITFPFAGGSKYSYLNYLTFENEITVIPLEYPGRGGRFEEKLLVEMDSIVEDLFQQVLTHLSKPYSFYGHSMGTIVLYLLTKKIIANNLPAPTHLFVSGKGGPSIACPRPLIHKLTGDDFVNNLRKIGGSPEELLNDTDLMSFFEPVLKADFEALENYHYQKNEPFKIPITAMVGTKDRSTYSETCTWENETTAPTEIVQFEGDHFFIFEHAEEIRQLIIEKLGDSISQPKQFFEL